MKRLFTAFIILIMAFSLVACSGIENSNNFDNPGERVSADNVTAEKVATLSAEYSWARPYCDNVIEIKKAEKFGIANNKGEELFTIKCDSLEPISAKYFVFTSEEPVETELGLMSKYTRGLVDITGKEILPQKYSSIKYVGDDYVLVGTMIDLINNIESFEMINLLTGEKYTKIDLSKYNGINTAKLFGNRLQIYYQTYGKNGNTYSIKDYGYDNYNFNTGELMYKSSQNNSDYYFNASINSVQGIYDGEFNLISSEYSLYSCDTYYIRSKEYTCINKGIELLPVTMEDCGIGYIDLNGNIVIELQYDRQYNNSGKVYNFYGNNCVAVEKDGNWGFIDKEGNVVLDFIYDNVEDFKNGYFLVELNDLYGYVNENGEITCPIELDFEDEDEQYCEDSQGRYIVNPENGKESKRYHSVSDDMPGKICSKINDTWLYGLLMYDKELIECKYENLSISEDGKVVVGNIGNTYDIYEIR